MVIWSCGVCSYRYIERIGDVSNSIPPGTPFEQIPPGWRCPSCEAPKEFFRIDDDDILRF